MGDRTQECLRGHGQDLTLGLRPGERVEGPRPQDRVDAHWDVGCGERCWHGPRKAYRDHGDAPESAQRRARRPGKGVGYACSPESFANSSPTATSLRSVHHVWATAGATGAHAHPYDRGGLLESAAHGANGPAKQCPTGARDQPRCLDPGPEPTWRFLEVWSRLTSWTVHVRLYMTKHC